MQPPRNRVVPARCHHLLHLPVATPPPFTFIILPIPVHPRSEAALRDQIAQRADLVALAGHDLVLRTELALGRNFR